MKPICDEGALRLAAAILDDTYKSYVESLRYIAKRKNYIEKVFPIIKQWDIWQTLKKEYNELKKIKMPRFYHKEKMEAFEKMEKPKRPTSYQVKMLNLYFMAEREKNSCELFYRSKRYAVLTLGKGIPGDELIERIKKEVGFEEDGTE